MIFPYNYFQLLTRQTRKCIWQNVTTFSNQNKNNPLFSKKKIMLSGQITKKIQKSWEIPLTFKRKQKKGISKKFLEQFARQIFPQFLSLLCPAEASTTSPSQRISLLMIFCQKTTFDHWKTTFASRQINYTLKLQWCQSLSQNRNSS